MSRATRLIHVALTFVFAVDCVVVATPAAAADPNSAASNEPQAAKKKRAKAAPKKPPPSTTKNSQKPKSSPPKAPDSAEPAEPSIKDLPLAAPRGAPETAIVASRDETRPSTESASPPAIAERDTGVSAPASSRGRPIGRELVSLEGGVGAGMRHFSYNDRRTASLSPYHLNGSPVFSLSGELYPLPLHDVVDVGVAGGYTSAIGVSSASANAADGPTVSTSWSHFRVGPRARLRLGVNDSTVLGASVSYGGESFQIEREGPASQTVLPDVAYRFIRPSLDARLSFGRVSPFAEIGYSAIVSAGSVTDHFPNASVSGVDAALGVAYRLMDHFELRATVAYRRYFYTLAPQPGDPYVAGGALDEMGDGKLALAWFM